MWWLGVGMLERMFAAVDEAVGEALARAREACVCEIRVLCAQEVLLLLTRLA